MKDLARTVCFILRHKPEDFGLKLDEYGYCSVFELINGINLKYNEKIVYKDISTLVESDSKSRYTIKGDKIKCNFGHSIKDIKVENSGESIPKILYHGTATKSLESIFQKGLIAGQRNWVHLTTDLDVAKQVGLRYAKTDDNLVILVIPTDNLKDKIITTGTSTFLIDRVPPEYLKLKE